MRRLLVLAAIVGSLLAVTGGAASTAVSTPPARILALTYHDKTGRGVAFDIVSDGAAAAPAKATIYVPSGYGLDLTRAPGSTIGDLFEILATADDEFVDAVNGTVKTGDPSTLPGDPAAQACAPGTHAAFWIASYRRGGHAVDLRFYVDPTTAAESSLGAYKLVACFDSPYVNPDVLRGLDLELGLSGSGASVFTPPANGTFMWRMFVTPYVLGTGTADTAATFEARTRVFAPHVLTEHVRYLSKSQKLVVTGRLTALGRPRRGVFVWIVGGGPNDLRLLGRVRTRAGGSYSFVTRVGEGRGARKYEAWAYRNESHAACVEASVAPAGCVDESISPPQAQHVRLTIPKLRKR